MAKLLRRTLLRGVCSGAAVTMAVPLLDCFLNESGTAFASGAPLPVRFGTWFWGLGVNEERWKPTIVGPDYDLGTELKPIEPYKDRISILSDFDVPLDGKSNIPHRSGGTGIRTGVATKGGGLPATTFDVLISDQIGTKTRFRQLDISATHGSNYSLSGRGAGSLNPTESSPMNLYTRVFGPDFADPNSADFTPDPAVMVRKSALSIVGDQRKTLEQRVGARDRERLDQYFTALRQTENQLAIQLEKPAPLEACLIPGNAAEEAPPNNDIELVVKNHEVMSNLLAMALACNQTRVFNLSYGGSGFTRSGSTISFHQLTHEEAIDPDLGYQPDVTWFIQRAMENFGSFVNTLGTFKEGDGTLLDNCLVLAHSEVNYAKIHSISGIPMMLAGRAGGKIKTGIHIPGKGTPASRVGLTMQLLMGVPVDAWGTGSLRTNKPVSELFV